MAIEQGDRAPDFSLTGTDGETYRLSAALERGPALVVFMKTTCGTCDLAYPYINRLGESYPEGWSLWSVAQDPAATASQFAAKHGVSTPVLPDVDRYAVSKAYDPPATPTLYLIDRGGTVALKSDGFSKADLNAISAALAERLGAAAAVVAPAGDGRPEFKPG
jgi:peroxiredoxin Q/BCP